MPSVHLIHLRTGTHSLFRFRNSQTLLGELYLAGRSCKEDRACIIWCSAGPAPLFTAVRKTAQNALPSAVRSRPYAHCLH